MEKFSIGRFIEWEELDGLLTKWVHGKFQSVFPGTVLLTDAERDEDDWNLRFSAAQNNFDEPEEKDAFVKKIRDVVSPYYAEDDEPFSADDCWLQSGVTAHIYGSANRRILEEIFLESGDAISIKRMTATYNGVHIHGEPAEQPEPPVDEAEVKESLDLIFRAVECGVLHSPSVGVVELLTEYDDGTECVVALSYFEAARDLREQKYTQQLHERIEAVNKLFESEEFFSRAYELYRLNWMHEHGITVQNILKEQQDWFDERECALGYLDYEERENYPNFRQYLEENGFGGELWACEDEFRENEFTNKPFIMALFASGIARVWLDGQLGDR